MQKNSYGIVSIDGIQFAILTVSDISGNEVVLVHQ